MWHCLYVWCVIMFLQKVSKWQNISFVANGLAEVAMDENKWEMRIEVEVLCKVGVIWGVERGLLEREAVLEDNNISISDISHHDASVKRKATVYVEVMVSACQYSHMDTNTHSFSPSLSSSLSCWISIVPEYKVGLLLCNNVRNLYSVEESGKERNSLPMNTEKRQGSSDSMKTYWLNGLCLGTWARYV